MTKNTLHHQMYAAEKAKKEDKYQIIESRNYIFQIIFYRFEIWNRLSIAGTKFAWYKITN